MQEVKNLSVNSLYPHPDNPRKDLGDLTELADSIKVSGILQNLTVVPAMLVERVWNRILEEPDKPENQNACVVLIGHRRLAAAKLAGLTEVPCAVVNMTPKEQIRLMLIENMQRAELTLYEQAQGFQLMLNMGETVESIAKDCGFSESTVRRRVKLLKFDDQTFRDATAKQITLDTLSEVAEIENAKERDAVLASYGDDDFRWNLNHAIREQKTKKNKPAVKKEILAFAQEVKEVDYNKYDIVLSVYYADYIPGKATWHKKSKNDEYVVVFKPTYAAVYKKRKKAPAKKRSEEEIAREQAVKQREAELTELTESAYKLRRDFVEKLTVGKADYPKLLEYAANTLMFSNMCYYGGGFTKIFADLMGLEAPERGYPYEWCCEYMAKCEPGSKTLIAAIYASYSDDKSNGYWRHVYNGAMPEYASNFKLDFLYEFLKAFGYELSGVERSLMDGTHPLLAATKKDGAS